MFKKLNNLSNFLKSDILDQARIFDLCPSAKDL